MGHRISKVYTRTGDNGTTGLADGKRVDKDAPEVIAMGSLDELNSHIGLLLTESLPQPIPKLLIEIQHDLFDAGGELSLEGSRLITAEQVMQLEQWLEDYNKQLPQLKEFILPGGCRAAAVSHVARSICRRAECQLTAAAWHIDLNPETLKYINRLSDLLFVIARHLNQQAGHADIYWHRDSKNYD